MCAETINAGVSAAEIAGISGGRSVEYEWESGGEKGYTKIGAGKRVISLLRRLLLISILSAV
jgi:hypothetical protein